MRTGLVCIVSRVLVIYKTERSDVSLLGSEFSLSNLREHHFLRRILSHQAIEFYIFRPERSKLLRIINTHL